MIPTPLEALDRLRRLVYHDYDGGVNGTCYQCPYSEGPVLSDGSKAPYEDYSNDPTEALFICHLPGRGPTEPTWGEYAPCTEQEWLDGHVPFIREALDART